MTLVGGDERIGRGNLGGGRVGLPALGVGQDVRAADVLRMELVVAPPQPKFTRVRCVAFATGTV